jgi:broad specificity phosphatase PhoE
MLLSPPPPPEGFPGEASRTPRPSLGTGALLWLVRHGRVTAPDVAYGDGDVPLSEEGLRQTEAVARSMATQPVRRVLSSPLQRARRLGQAIARSTGSPLQLDDRLKELHRGDWQGLTRTEYAARWAREQVSYWDSPLTWRGHGGESEEQLVERAWPALVEATRMAEGAVGVVTAHRQLIRGLTAAAIGVAPGASHRMELEPAHGVLLRDAEGGWILERTNAPSPGSPHAAEPPDGPPEDVVTQLR